MGLGCELRGLWAELFSLRFPTSVLHNFNYMEGLVHLLWTLFFSILVVVLVRCIQLG